MFNLAGAVFYLAVALLAARAGWRTRPSWPAARRGWYLIALAFALLAVWRLGHGEEVVQAWARGLAMASGQYEARRSVQGPVVVVGMLLGYGWLTWLAFAPASSAALRWARIAALALLGYSGLRALSFHPVDALIYAGLGPFHVNHAIDLGLAAIVASCAVRAPR